MNQENALTHFEYQDGELFWKVPTCSNMKVGQPAGSNDSKGYKQISFKGKVYRLHRIIFLMHHGYMPDFVDHIDGNKKNNRIENLRPTDKSKNNWNAKTRSDNTSGFKGVSFNKQSNRWFGYIMKHGKHIHLGSFKDPEAAHNAVVAARKELHGTYARLH